MKSSGLKFSVRCLGHFITALVITCHINVNTKPSPVDGFSTTHCWRLATHGKRPATCCRETGGCSLQEVRMNLPLPQLSLSDFLPVWGLPACQERCGFPSKRPFRRTRRRQAAPLRSSIGSIPGWQDCSRIGVKIFFLPSACPSHAYTSLHFKTRFSELKPFSGHINFPD